MTVEAMTAPTIALDLIHEPRGFMAFPPTTWVR